jgi:hypothetical protein
VSDHYLLADGFWLGRGLWLGKIVKLDVTYPCKFLGKRTDIGILMGKRKRDESPAGPEYLLTLDGEGVDVDGLDVRTRSYEEIDIAPLHSLYEKDRPVVDWIKTTLVPMLSDAAALNQSVEFIRKNKKHRLMADDAIFRRARRDQGLWFSVIGSRRSKIGVRVMTKFLKDKGRNYIEGERDHKELEAREKEALKREGLEP